MNKDITHPDYKLLFEAVQLSDIFEDSKTFPDCTPVGLLSAIYNDFLVQKQRAGFSLADFVKTNFKTVENKAESFVFDEESSPKQHIERLWNYLERSTPNADDGSTYIRLPHSFIVPGGRFQEIYYWDSYFTMLGLRDAGEIKFIEQMVANFAYLIDNYGFIPNGNRTYFLSRSQPPFFSLMVELLAEINGKEILINYLPQLEKEYNFWMDGSSDIHFGEAYRRVLKLDDGTLLNRYWDDNPTPRPESYKEDVELAEKSNRDSEELYRDLRAACESGWDFSSRWFEDVNDFGSIRTTQLAPIDLNCLLWKLEDTIAKGFELIQENGKSANYRAKAESRKKEIQTLFWNEKDNFFYDYDIKNKKLANSKSLAAAFPLFFSIALPKQAEGIKSTIEHLFAKKGGVLTTLVQSGQQWDAPNGWAPLQWITVSGLKNYGFDLLAKEILQNWIALNEAVFEKSGKFTEKYNVEGDTDSASGGEYPNQDGFGWTNGVFAAMKASYF